MKVNILTVMKHFIQMMIIANLVVYTIVVSHQTALPPRVTKFLAKSQRVIYKRKRIEKL